MVFSPIDEIKNRLDIVEVIGSYIKLQKAGANFRALCPFHSEKNPSLFVSPARQIWHCFGCSKGGNVFQFVMDIEGIEFGDALRILAQKAGVELKRERPELRTERNRLYEICELATRFFEKQLDESKAGQEAKKYLLSRGISEDSIKKWRLGYSPDTWQGLSAFLVSKGYQREQIERAGLSIKNEQGSFYDRFRGRIIFPIFDLNSQVVGFGGRVFKEKDKTEVAKYVNTPNTLLYDKSRILYGLDRAKVEIRKADSCILVEGYTDVILAHQVGSQNVVATSGTALTPYQLKILGRYSQNIFTAFDMDIAGDTATKRGIDLAQSLGFNIKVILMPGKDPAEIIFSNPKDWQRLIKEAKSILDFYFENTFSKFNKEDPEGKKEIAKILLPVLKRIPNKIEQSHWLTKLARELEVKEESIAEELRKIKSDRKEWFFEETSFEPEKKSRKEILEERILTLVLKSPSFLNFFQERDYDLFSENSREILTKIRENPDLKLEDKISPETLNFLNYLFLKSEIEPDEDIDLEKEIKSCFRELKFLNKKEKLNLISQEIKRAEESKDLKKVNLLVEEFNKLSQELES